MISAKELLEKGTCEDISCSKECPILAWCNKNPFNFTEEGGFPDKVKQHLRTIIQAEKETPRTATLRERLEEYEKAHRALWQECKDDLNSMLDDLD